jgi:hypothetical protein
MVLLALAAQAIGRLCVYFGPIPCWSVEAIHDGHFELRGRRRPAGLR